MTKVQWVVQQNLTNSADFLALQAACKNTGVDFTGVDVVPFSTELPLFDRRKRSIFYGSTTFNKLINEDKSLSAGLFFDPGLFSITRYIREWGENMLNYGANTTTFKQLMKEKFDPEKLLFIRPDDDGKSFAGEVIKYGDFVRWFESL
jgi:hypothetical protein